ncbi:fatty acid binding protein [Holotrichia oblita]|uniref:Fatty acid binding protein n=2 Tax=Holotrichia oblita TaxID=644536 RepID=A0ACB9T2K2_HOLOL|nr:fatty acid binding protein [Holotrichia oblita]KAI4460959.1 fatty acid binding protein [Holotrichia oblita]
MVEIVGKYQHQRNENLEEYFKAIGVPYIARKMMLSTSPSLDITVDETNEWCITTSTLLRTTVIKFQLGVEYEEHMPGGVTIKSTTTKEGDTLKTISVAPNGSKVFRTYVFTEDECVLTLQHTQTGIEAKRYFKRL